MGSLKAAGAPEKMYEYYRRQDVLPTFANLGDEAAVEAYGRARERVLRERLAIPAQFFRGARVLEFGSDTGENALIFARWGARMTIVEPNPNAHPAIDGYFARYAPAGSLERVASADVLGYRDETRYDAVVAEGFIYTVQPTRAWLDAFASRLLGGGLAIVSYYERRGALVELALKALYAGAKRLGKRSASETAEGLYAAKWASIPHTRTFESWTMDVLENPFVRSRYFLEAASLIEEAADAGFDLYSSWPMYRDPLEITWHKAPIDPVRKRMRARAHIERSVLGFVFGQGIFLTGEEPEVAAIVAGVDATVAAVCATLDAHAGDYAAVCAALAVLAERVAEARTFSSPSGRGAVVEGRALLQSLHAAFSLLGRGDVAGLERLTSNDAALLAGWGLPAHFAVLRRCDP